jgi:hypothetical protein
MERWIESACGAGRIAASADRYQALSLNLREEALHVVYRPETAEPGPKATRWIGTGLRKER